MSFEGVDDLIAEVDELLVVDVENETTDMTRCSLGNGSVLDNGGGVDPGELKEELKEVREIVEENFALRKTLSQMQERIAELEGIRNHSEGESREEQHPRKCENTGPRIEKQKPSSSEQELDDAAAEAASMLSPKLLVGKRVFVKSKGIGRIISYDKEMLSFLPFHNSMHTIEFEVGQARGEPAIQRILLRRRKLLHTLSGYSDNGGRKFMLLQESEQITKANALLTDAAISQRYLKFGVVDTENNDQVLEWEEVEDDKEEECTNLKLGNGDSIDLLEKNIGFHNGLLHDHLHAQQHGDGDGKQGAPSTAEQEALEAIENVRRALSQPRPAADGPFDGEEWVV